jgi:hypothetical protein
MNKVNKVNKAEVKRDIRIITSFIIATKDYYKILKRLDRRAKALDLYTELSDLERNIKEQEEQLILLNKRLDCKHFGTEVIEHENGHTGIIDYETICTNCKFQLDWN